MFSNLSYAGQAGDIAPACLVKVWVEDGGKLSVASVSSNLVAFWDGCARTPGEFICSASSRKMIFNVFAKAAQADPFRVELSFLGRVRHLSLSVLGLGLPKSGCDLHLIPIAFRQSGRQNG